jgi:hypothetical protein
MPSIYQGGHIFISGDFYHIKFLRPELILRHKPVAADGLSHTENFV